MLDRLNKLREERTKGEQGFTLIELLVVVVIIGILIAIAIPLYLNYTKGASDKAAESDLRGAVSALEQCNSTNNSYPPQAKAGDLSAVLAAGAVSPSCDGTSTVSAGSSVKYVTDTNGTAYTAWSKSTSGTGKFYCYNSANGGSVKTEPASWTVPTKPGPC